MNAQMIEGLVGASANIKMAGVPMGVYRQASAEGDAEKMKRALGYAGECTARANQYQEKLEEGIKDEAKTEREEAKLKQEAAEKRREEHKSAENGKAPAQESDTVQISEAAKAALKDPSTGTGAADGHPAFYSESGKVSVPPAEPTLSVSA